MQKASSYPHKKRVIFRCFSLMLYDGLINSLFYGFQYPLHDFIRIDAVRYLLGYLVNIDIVSYPFGSSTVTVCRSALCASLFCVMGVSPLLRFCHALVKGLRFLSWVSSPPLLFSIIYFSDKYNSHVIGIPSLLTNSDIYYSIHRYI